MRAMHAEMRFRQRISVGWCSRRESSAFGSVFITDTALAHCRGVERERARFS